MSALSSAKGFLVAAVFLQIVGTALAADEPAPPGQSEPKQRSPEAGAEIAEEAPTHRDFMTIITDDPLVKDEISLPAMSYLSHDGEPGGPGPVQEWAVTAEFQKRITERLGFGVEYGFTVQNTVHDQTRSGFENLVIFAKYQAYENTKHEFLVSLGVVREFGGTGTQRIGVPQYGVTTPTLFLGKGLGDLPNNWLRPVGITANFGFAVSDRELSFSQVTNPLTGETEQVSNNGLENRWVGGLSLQWSGPYVRERGIDLRVPDFVTRLTPLVELAWSSPASSPSDVGTQFLLASGVFYTGTWFELGVEALIPLNRATGRGIGVVAQFNVPLEDLLPNSLGKPLFN
jgi:hypothetical protein